MKISLVKVELEKIQKILIIRNDRIGDIVLTLPMITQLKRQYPHITIHFLMRDYCAPLAYSHPDISKVLLIPQDHKNRDSHEKLLNEVKAEHYDMAIHVRSDYYLSGIISAAKIPIRLGRGGIRWFWRLNYWYFQKRKNASKHEVDLNLDMISDLIKIPKRDQLQFNLHYSPIANIAVKAFLNLHQCDQYTIIHPGSGGSAIDLPIETYAELINQYPFPGKIIITGRQQERELFEYLVAHVNKPLIDAIDVFSLEELICLIAKTKLFISNSTGPLHIARAFDRPLLGFYTTELACHPRRWGPYGNEESHSVIPPNEDFQTVLLDKDIGRENMKKITAADIIQKLNSLYPSPAVAPH